MKRLFAALLFTTVTPLIGGCCLFTECSGQALASSVDLEFRSLDDGRVPVELAADGDARDVKRKDRARYRRARGNDGELGRRHKLTARRDGAAATEYFDRRQRGDGVCWVRVSLHQIRGLEDGVSSAFLERQSLSGGVDARVDAVWNAGINGLTAQARLGGVPVGAPVDFPGEPQLFLRLEASGGLLTLSAARATSGAYDGYDTPRVLFTTLVSDAEIYRTAVGVEGLSRKGTFYFSNLTFRVNTPPGAGDEKLVAAPVALAMLNLVRARGDLDLPAPHDLSALGALIGNARLLVDFQARQILEGAAATNTLDPTTNLAALRKSLDRAVARCMDVEDKLIQLQSLGETNGRPVMRKLEKATEAVEVILGQLLGYQRKSHRTMSRTVNLVF